MEKLKLTLISLCYITTLSNLSAKEYTLDLLAAEQLALKKSWGQALSVKELEKLEYENKKKNGSLFPRLSVSNRMTSNDFKSFSTDYGATLEQTIPNPLKWSAEKKVITLKTDIAKKKQTQSAQTVLESIRKDYFELKVIEEKIAIAKETVALISDLKDKASIRYEQGLISSFDLRRVLVQFKESHYRLQKERSLHALKMKQLTILLGLNEKATLKLTSALDVSRSFISIEQHDLEDMIAENSNIDITLKKLLYQKSQQETKVASYYYMPDLSFGVEYFNKQKLQFRATLRWELFSGGSDYFTHEQAILEQSKQLIEAHQEKDHFQIKITTKMNTLLLLKEEYKMEISLLNDYDEILKSSNKRFFEGTLSSQNLNDDLKTFIQQKNKVLDKQVEIISVFAEFSNLLSNDAVFYKWVLSET